MKPLYVVFAVIVLVLAGVIAWLMFVPGASDFLASKRTITEQAEIDEMAIAFVSLPYPDDYNATRVPGYVENLSGLKFSEVTLELQLMTPGDEKRELIEHTIREVEPGTRRTFDINAGTIGETRNAAVEITKIVVVE